MSLTLSPEAQALIAAKWRSRAAMQGLKPKSMAYKRAELEFTVGAVAAIDAINELADGKGQDVRSCIPPSWFFSAMCGEQIFGSAA